MLLQKKSGIKNMQETQKKQHFQRDKALSLAERTLIKGLTMDESRLSANLPGKVRVSAPALALSAASGKNKKKKGPKKRLALIWWWWCKNGDEERCNNIFLFFIQKQQFFAGIIFLFSVFQVRIKLFDFGLSLQEIWYLLMLQYIYVLE